MRVPYCASARPILPARPSSARGVVTPLLAWIPLILAGSAIYCEETAATRSRPNVILILADDLGYGDLGCYGGKILTPRIDRLAESGARFTDAHSPSSVCTPTRYGLLTGRYCWRSKLKSGVLGGLSPRLIEPGRMTIASMLKEEGYHTACVGKWHLGMNWQVKSGLEVAELSIESRRHVFNVDYAAPIAEGPNAVGFDEFFGISASLDMVPYTFIENDRVAALPTEDRDFPMMHGREGGRTRKGPTAPGFDAADVLPAIVRRSREYIAARAGEARRGRPFFLYVPLASPHTPILPTAEWQGRSGMNPYADFVMQTDAAVGEILDAVETHDLADSTLVVFTSDNGCSPQAKFDELAVHGHHPSGPLRGAKADIFEGGHRVPLVARWPGRVPPKTVSEQLVSLTDLMATLAEALGRSLPPDAGEDSVSFLAALTGTDGGGAAGRDHIVSHSINGTFAVRRGPWKLILAPDSGGWSAPRPNSPAAAGLPPVQLYHLGNDLGEQENLQGREPEKVRELTELMEKFVADGRSAPAPSQTTGRGDAQPPNIVLFMADDFGYECVGANGGESYRTPVLDRLAAGGMRFDRCHVQPLCTPTRVQLMTGMYNVRNYVAFGVLDPEATTFAHLLKKAGYATAVVGKWQLGRDKDLPRHFGFDESYLWQHTRRPPRYANPGLEINGVEKDFGDGEYGPTLVNDYALDFITRHKDRPFFLYYPMILTHDPFQPTPDSPDWDPAAKGEQVNRHVRHFGEMTAYMDKMIGRVVEKLDELGLRENTLVLFLGDNGTLSSVVSRFRGADYQGGKGSTTARGTHVPLIANWPGRVPPGRVNADLIDSTDFLPTLCEAAGVELPAELPIDGRSFLAQLLGRPGSPREWIYGWYARDGGPTARHEFAINREYKLYRDGRLFDLAADPFEAVPLAEARRPEAAKAAAARLQSVLDQYADARPARLRAAGVPTSPADNP